MIPEVVKKIRNRGYWRINFQPMVYDKQNIDLSKCKDIVDKNTVNLRGWDYPHFPRQIGEGTGLNPDSEFWQGWTDWSAHIEFWRMYQSGQFLHYLAVRDDWFQEDMFIPPSFKTVPVGSSLDVLSTTFLITEIFEFLSRLIRESIYKKGVKINISLVNTKGRTLQVYDFNRLPFMRERKTGADIIEFTQQYSENEIAGVSKDEALKALIYFFERFDWTEKDGLLSILKADQEKLLSGRL